MCFDGESPDFYAETWPRARKNYQCYECLKTIPKGTQHCSAKGVWNNEFESFRICLDCQELRATIEEKEISEGCFGAEATPPFGCLIEIAKEYGLLATAKQDDKE